MTSRSFTLVELLVVVAILVILSALGAGTYQESLVRAKTSRVIAEFRTYASAIEAYHVDQNAYPRMAHFRFYRDLDFDVFEKVPVNGILSRSLTTPVAYLVTINRADPFMAAILTAPLDERFYTYQVHSEYMKRLSASSFWPRAEKYFGPWRLVSVGPDLAFDHRFANSAQLPYDPTNGLFSIGNIIRSPRYAGQECPPVPDLLGPH
ncbi:MAG: prepilin-type N-terminal cleavage/methylation domain-containing protein [Candidatus Sumerlaeaceae bacterium]|nr:prepilin-type N-terminal cleavage/methylation domain-containing protein [Candidatus Sumerlaeaceae bacterium]